MSDGIYPRSNYTNTSSEWQLCTQIYEEGVLVSSSRDPTESMKLFVFDKPSGRPVSKVKEFLFPPSAQSFQVDHDDDLDQHNGSDAPHLSKTTHTHHIKSAKLWTPDKPHTYTLVVVLRSCRDGSIIQTESCRVAFRMIDVKDGLLRVNTRPVMIRGTNADRGFFGRGLSEVDIQMMKRNNINAIRIPFHFQHSILYELCTLYGLYVVNEAHTQGEDALGSRDEADREILFLQALSDMHEVGKNHPCIIIWSLGRDPLYTKIHDRSAQWLRKR